VTPITRRDFIASSTAGLAAAWTYGCGSFESPQGATVAAQSSTPIQGDRILLKGGCVLSLDPQVGDFDVADVLIEGTRIAAVGPNLTATATVVDASNAIVMPGFIDTHRHMWQGTLRNILPNGLLSDYVRDILMTARPVMRPEDVRIGDLVTSLGAINAGVTTLLDWSHIGNSPEHTDAAIDGLRASGVRAVYGFGAGAPGPANQYPQDIQRLRKQHFSSDDQLLTLALAGGMDAREWAAAREVKAPISVHAGGNLAGLEKALGSDVTYIHCTTFTEGAWTMVADSGGHISIACPIEMEMGHGVPPIQQSLDHGIRPSLSVDVETEMPGDLFAQMRAVFTLQRMLAINQPRAAGKHQPKLLTARDVIEFATIEGARANHLDSKVGTLTPGKQADIVMLRTDAINVMPVNNAYGAVVLGMDTSNVDTVFIAGKVMKQAGQLVGVDLGRIKRDAEQSRDFIVAKTGWKKSRVSP
jgi:5-methylthioadenosine/S-adenosylhomocysteine deaminase